ncbi:amidohydrolase family protein [Agromyces cerinus]|uniref:L-fuconolactonase n=1 Tax=Agromyces cerinus subsp. cerinus TaxID=232089 RepID=A0A1N6IA21_9MICO|nr:amidohydrolase family protein [Agromyces cerinus]SIO28829.1 L-fuconolactonase [Agromyces cerinus subsp. cerinus]
MTAMRMVDAHVHLWDVERVHLSWFHAALGLEAQATATRFEHGAAELVADDVELRAAIAVQAGDTVGEAEWLVQHAAASGAVPAVVLQYEPGEPWAGAVQPVIDAGPAAPAPHVAGIRVATPQGAADFSDVTGLDRLAEGLAASDRVLELLIRPEQLGSVRSLAARHPGLVIVVCHLGLGGGEPDGAWREALRSLTPHDSVLAKVSGIHRGDAAPDLARTRMIASTALDALGAERLMFGSDWPMSARVAPYREIVARTASALPPLDSGAADAFWSGTASRAYAL